MQQDTTQVDAAQSEMASEAYLAQLKATFEQLPNDIPLYLFTAKGHEDVFTHANRQVIRAFRELSDKIHLREYDLDHELAKKYLKNGFGGVLSFITKGSKSSTTELIDNLELIPASSL